MTAEWFVLDNGADSCCNWQLVIEGTEWTPFYWSGGRRFYSQRRLLATLFGKCWQMSDDFVIVVLIGDIVSSMALQDNINFQIIWKIFHIHWIGFLALFLLSVFSIFYSLFSLDFSSAFWHFKVQQSEGGVRMDTRSRRSSQESTYLKTF